MTNTFRLVVKRILAGTVIGTLVVSRTLGAIVPGWSFDENAAGVNWADIRENLESPNPNPSMNADLVDIVVGVDFGSEWEDAVRMSYRIASREDVKWLDGLWLDMLIAHGDSALLAQFLALRGGLAVDEGGAFDDEDASVNRWLSQVCCDDCS